VAGLLELVHFARHGCLKPVISDTWEAEIGRILDRDQPGQIVRETLISKITRAKGTRGVAQVV
jgi:predicted secreted protein